jgi:hypothetical protein
LKPDFLHDRRELISMGKELGCGLLTVLVFTAPLWAFSMASRGPRFAFTAVTGLIVVLAIVVLVSRAFRKR